MVGPNTCRVICSEDVGAFTARSLISAYLVITDPRSSQRYVLSARAGSYHLLLESTGNFAVGVLGGSWPWLPQADIEAHFKEEVRKEEAKREAARKEAAEKEAAERQALEDASKVEQEQQSNQKARVFTCCCSVTEVCHSLERLEILAQVVETLKVPEVRSCPNLPIAAEVGSGPELHKASSGPELAAKGHSADARIAEMLYMTSSCARNESSAAVAYKERFLASAAGRNTNNDVGHGDEDCSFFLPRKALYEVRPELQSSVLTAMACASTVLNLTQRSACCLLPSAFVTSACIKGLLSQNSVLAFCPRSCLSLQHVGPCSKLFLNCSGDHM